MLSRKEFSLPNSAQNVMTRQKRTKTCVCQEYESSMVITPNKARTYCERLVAIGFCELFRTERKLRPQLFYFFQIFRYRTPLALHYYNYCTRPVPCQQLLPGSMYSYLTFHVACIICFAQRSIMIQVQVLIQY